MMFTDLLINNFTFIFVIIFLFICYVLLLGKQFDARFFIALNFSIISFWVFTSYSFFYIKVLTVLFVLLFLIGYLIKRSNKFCSILESKLDFDSAHIVIALSFSTLCMNIYSGVGSIGDVVSQVEQRAGSAESRFVAYLFMANGLFVTHMICQAAAQIKWSFLQKLGIFFAIAAAITGLSKSSFLPIILTLLFIYNKKIGYKYTLIFLALSVAAAVFFVMRLFEGLDYFSVLKIIYERVIKNVDVIDFIESIGERGIHNYPFSSFAFPLWPFFQLSKSDFIVPGIWFYGSVYGDWRGVGPNPTFIGDQVIAAMGSGLIFAPFLGYMLKLFNCSKYRVFIAGLVYQFLQDWYFSCVTLSMFIIISVAYVFLSGIILWSRRVYTTLFKTHYC